MMSRSRTLPSLSSSRQMMIAWKVSGLSQRPGDHGLAAGLDALGDGDFALARKELYRAHLAQIHAHRVVGALDRLRRDSGLATARLRGKGAARLLVLGRPRPPRAPRPSSVSTTLMPMSESIAIVSSICSEDTSSDGSTAFSSS